MLDRANVVLWRQKIKAGYGTDKIEYWYQIFLYTQNINLASSFYFELGKQYKYSWYTNFFIQSTKKSTIKCCRKFTKKVCEYGVDNSNTKEVARKIIDKLKKCEKELDNYNDELRRGK